MSIEVTLAYSGWKSCAVVFRAGAEVQHLAEQGPVVRQVEKHPAVAVEHVGRGAHAAVGARGCRVHHHVKLSRAQILAHAILVEQIQFRRGGCGDGVTTAKQFQQVPANETRAAREQYFHAATWVIRCAFVERAAWLPVALLLSTCLHAMGHSGNRVGTALVREMESERIISISSRTAPFPPLAAVTSGIACGSPVAHRRARRADPRFQAPADRSHRHP